MAIRFPENEIKDERRIGIRDSRKAGALNRLRKFTPDKDCS
jgi:hypothetical protein